MHEPAAHERDHAEPNHRPCDDVKRGVEQRGGWDRLERVQERGDQPTALPSRARRRGRRRRGASPPAPSTSAALACRSRIPIRIDRTFDTLLARCRACRYTTKTPITRNAAASPSTFSIANVSIAAATKGTSLTSSAVSVLRAEGLQLAHGCERFLGVSRDPELGPRPGAPKGIVLSAHTLLERRGIHHEHRVVRVDTREGARSAHHLDRGRDVGHLDRLGRPLSLDEQDRQPPALLAESSHHVVERFVGERVVPERGADDRLGVDADHVEALLAGQQRTGVLQPSGPRDRQGEGLLLVGRHGRPRPGRRSRRRRLPSRQRSPEASEPSSARSRRRRDREPRRTSNTVRRGRPVNRWLARYTTGDPLPDPVRRRASTAIRAPSAAKPATKRTGNASRSALGRVMSSRRVLDERAAGVQSRQDPERPGDDEHLPRYPGEPPLEGVHLEGPDERDARDDAEDDQTGGAGGHGPRDRDRSGPMGPPAPPARTWRSAMTPLRAPRPFRLRSG